MPEPFPATGPTHGRPWPGDRVRINTTGQEGTVAHYEYGWNNHSFPVRIDYGVTTLQLPSDVTVLHSTRATVLPMATSATAATPATAAHDATGTTPTPRTTPGTGTPRRHNPDAA